MNKMNAVFRRPTAIILRPLSSLLPPRIHRSSIRSSSSSSSSSRPGLFSLPGLHSPSDFPRLARQALAACDAVRSSSLPPAAGAEILYELDSISNFVCSVIDAAELCRSVHSDPAFRAAAEEAFRTVGEYIQELNTDPALYAKLREVCDDGALMSDVLTEEQRRMARLLRAEFERDGIHLCDGRRAEVSEATNRVTALETEFSSNIIGSKKYFALPKTDVEALIPDHLLRQFGPEVGSEEHLAVGAGESESVVSSDAPLVNTILKYCPNPSTRKEAWFHHNTTCPENLEVLEALIRTRHEVSELLGFESYAQRVLSDKMASDQKTVRDFLDRMSSVTRPRADSEVATMLDAKRRVEGDAGRLEPWDVSFYRGIIRASACKFESSELTPYLSVAAVLEGVGEISSRLFGIRMVEASMEPEERWCEEKYDVKKLELFHETEGLIGTIYLDLYPRPQKYNHSAHFSVRLGLVSREGGSDGGAALQQLPIVALVCNFASPDDTGVSLLSHSEVEIFFHEFGHALHSLLSRTSFQHLSGTRAPVDFVEIPSHLFEYFANDPGSLRMFARHHSTGDPVPEDLLSKLATYKSTFRGIEAQTQIVYAAFDQELFGPPPRDGTPRAPPAEIFSDLHARFGVPHGEGTFWFARFGHLVSYGAGYYGYLYDEVIAADIWRSVFRRDGGDPLRREAGERLRRELLVHGGARDPRRMLRNLLEREPRVDSYYDALGK